MKNLVRSRIIQNLDSYMSINKVNSYGYFITKTIVAFGCIFCLSIAVADSLDTNVRCDGRV